MDKKVSVKVLKPIMGTYGSFGRGVQTELPSEVAKEYVRLGYVEEDKPCESTMESGKPRPYRPRK